MKATNPANNTRMIELRVLPAQARSRTFHTTESIRPRRWHCLLVIGCLLPVAGCVAPPKEPNIKQPTREQVTSPNGGRMVTREWVGGTPAWAAPLLPPKARETLDTEKLRDADGKPIGVFAHFRLKPERLDSIPWNFPGLWHTKQVTSPQPGTAPSPPWEGFVDVDAGLTFCDGLKPHARLGTPDPAKEIPGSYVVITHGLFGSLEGTGMEHNVQTLRGAGYHVLAIELRGHGGQEDEPNLKKSMTFGLKETADLLAAARWLKTKHGAKRVGLVAYSVSGFESLLAAWLDAAPLPPADAKRRILKYAPPPTTEPAFNGGMFIISAPVGIQTMSQVLEQRWGTYRAPVKATFQQMVDKRLRGFEELPPHNIWDFIVPELRRDDCAKAYRSEAKLRADMEWFLDLQRNNWSVGVRRMEAVRTPILILSAANDPLATGQDVAELFARVNNPNIGVILLNSGGHMGFKSLSADYFYSLMTAFFNPATAPRRVTPPRRSHSAI